MVESGREQPAPQAPDSPTQPPGRLQPVTVRSIVLGCAGAITVCVLQVVSKATPQTVMVPVQSVLTLLSGAIAWLFLLALINLGLRRWRPLLALQPSEFAVVYATVTVAASIGAADELMQLFPMWLYPFRKTQDLLMGPFRPYIARWLIPRNPAVVEPYYSGHVRFWTLQLIRAWIVPWACWMTWLIAFGGTMWSWNVILRRRWVDHDRLSFPSVQLPLEMCRAAGFGGLLWGPAFCLGLGLAALLESANQLHALFPIIPSVPLGYGATPLLESWPRPWNALAPMSLDWNTLYLGVAYFIPVDILFSGWFCYLGRKLLEVAGYAVGWRQLGWDAPGFPYTRSQAAGAWISLFFILVWAERQRLGRVLVESFSRRHIEDDSGEPGSYRWAGRFLILGTIYLVAFSVAGGMSLSLALVFYGFFWMLNITMTRIYAQVGPPILELYFLDPQKTITTIFGTFWQSPQSLTNFSLMYWINRTDRGQPMAHQLAAFHIGKSVGVHPRALGRIVFLAFLIGCITCTISYLHWAYRLGEDQFIEGGWRESFSPVAVARINEWVKTPKLPDMTELSFMAAGGLITLVLARLHYSAIGFALHPIGFALSLCYAMEYDWPAFLLMWAIKGSILRYSGRAGFVRFSPFFLGLILGGLVTPMLWGFLRYSLEWYH